LTIYDGFKESVRFFDHKRGLNIEHLQQILEPYSTTESCRLEGWWSADERYFFDDENRQEIIRTGYRVIMQTPADEYTYNSNLAESSFSYTIGNSSLFSLGLLNEVAQLNFEAVLQELAVLSAFELNTVQGLNIDSEQDPRKCFLMYHHEPHAFGIDLGSKFGGLEASLGLLPKDIQQIAQKSKNVICQSLNTGVVVFHRDLIDGNLADFYRCLKEYLESMS